MKAWTAHWLARVLVCAASAFVAAVVVAIVLAVADLYVTGHGGASLARPWISLGPVGEVSRAELVFWALTLFSSTAAFFTTRGLMRPSVRPARTLFLD
jgi:hypothetical protein